MKIPPEEHGNWHFWGPKIKNFLGEHIPRPLYLLAPSALVFLLLLSCAYLDGKPRYAPWCYNRPSARISHHTSFALQPLPVFFYNTTDHTRGCFYNFFLVFRFCLTNLYSKTPKYVTLKDGKNFPELTETHSFTFHYNYPPTCFCVSFVKVCCRKKPQ